MKILVDENNPLITVNSLLGQGHDVWDIRGSESEGMIDDLLWDAAQQEKRSEVLITADKGFSQHRMESHLISNSLSVARTVFSIMGSLIFSVVKR